LAFFPLKISGRYEHQVIRAFFIISFAVSAYANSRYENVSYAGFSDLPGLMMPCVRWAAMTDNRPLFSFIIDMPVDKSLGFNSRFMTYLDYVLSIHYFTLSLSIFNIF